MSRVLDHFPEPPEKRRILPKYNWDLWFDGRIHALSPSEYGDIYTFRNSAHTIAARRGLRLRTLVVGDEFVVHVFDTRVDRQPSTKRVKPKQSGNDRRKALRAAK